jgi:hypothetical protein
LNPELYQSDWFVQGQAEHFNVRTGFVFLLRALCIVFPPWMAVGLVYLVSWFGSAAAVFRLADQLTGDPLAARAAVPLVLVLTPFWTLGGNDLVHSILVPSMAAWALGLWGVVQYFEKRLLRSALLLGLATGAQALVGLHLAALLGVHLLLLQRISPAESAQSWNLLLTFGSVFLVAAAPTLGPLLMQQFHGSVAETASESPSLFYIMAAFRSPHHYLFHSFDPVRSLRFFTLLAGGLGATVYLDRVNSRFQGRTILAFTSIAGLFCLIGYLGTEIWPLLPITKLQLFKMTVPVKVMMLVALAALLTKTAPDVLTETLERWLTRYPLLAALVGVTFLSMLIYLQPARMDSKIYPFNYRQEDPVEAHAWVRNRTEADALFAIPPSWSSFRSHAQRAILVNHKAFPFGDEDIRKWYERLLAFAPIDLPARSTPDLQAHLDSAYHALTASALDSLVRKYAVDYVVRTEPITPPDARFNTIFEHNGVYIYATGKRHPTAGADARSADRP